MRIQSTSITIVTARLVDVRSFYERHFDARPSFDCGWYVVLRLGTGTDGPEICLMEPRGGASEFAGGATFNVLVGDADEAFVRLSHSGEAPVIPLEDHPWGDRGFGVRDPAGMVVYCYHPIEPAPEFRSYFVPPAENASGA